MTTDPESTSGGSSTDRRAGGNRRTMTAAGPLSDIVDKELVEGVHYPEWEGEAPTNYQNLRESFILALAVANEDLDIYEIIHVVDEAVVNNEEQLEWPDDTDPTTPIESRLYDDIDTIATTANQALNELATGQLDEVENSLRKIKDRAGVWNEETTNNS